MKYCCALIYLFAFLIIFSSCSEEDNNNEIQLRLSNSSSFDYKNITVNTTTGNVNFEDINSGEITQYKSFTKAYRYAFIQLEIDGSIYTIQPIDYVGETPLSYGKYTYKINASDSNDQYGRLSLTLVKD